MAMFTKKQLEDLRKAGKIRDFKMPEEKSKATGERREEAAAAKKAKYRNQKVELDGHIFDSKKEAARYVELRMMAAVGEITGLKCQEPYQLSVCKYIADFVYQNAKGETVVEDVKSKATRRLSTYRLKKKMMLHELGIEIIEK